VTQPPVHYANVNVAGYGVCGYNFELVPPDVPEHWITKDQRVVTCENCKAALGI
jgi:hypothetical protein